MRHGIERLLPDGRFGEAQFVGSFWTRDNRIEVDLVGGREWERAGIVEFVGSIKWRDNRTFGRKDLAALAAQRAAVPGATEETRLVGVSRSRFDVTGLDIELGAEDIVDAYG